MSPDSLVVPVRPCRQETRAARPRCVHAVHAVLDLTTPRILRCSSCSLLGHFYADCLVPVRAAHHAVAAPCFQRNAQHWRFHAQIHETPLPSDSRDKCDYRG